MPSRARQTTTALVPLVPPALPRWGNAVTRAIGRAGLRGLGWRLAGDIPNVPKLVAIAAPHTCTADVFVGLAVMLALGARVRWFGKHTIFWWPLGTVLRWLGGIPVDRRHTGGLVGLATRLMEEHHQLCLALAPEGTRKKVDRWKSGFYRIAYGAGVPILPVALDYRRGVAQILEPLVPSGHYEADLAKIQSLFCAGMARHPERY
jgi:1-acyl-sn-glycerol-3-phosphate acyltransferase